METSVSVSASPHTLWSLLTLSTHLLEGYGTRLCQYVCVSMCVCVCMCVCLLPLYSSGIVHSYTQTKAQTALLQC